MISFRLSTALLVAATGLLMMPAVFAYYESVTTCDSATDVQRLSCASGVISVRSALYGRMNNMMCGQESNTMCAQEGTVDTLKTWCDGKMECEYTTNAVSDPDPCPGVSKYLQTNYTCIPALTVTACEHSYAFLYCDVDQHIFVYGAHYGRSDRTTCSHNRPESQTADVSCSQPNDLVAENCNGLNSCMIHASNMVFGDPCPGTYKYLDVAYACIYPSTGGHDPSEDSEEE